MPPTTEQSPILCICVALLALTAQVWESVIFVVKDSILRILCVSFLLSYVVLLAVLSGCVDPNRNQHPFKNQKIFCLFFCFNGLQKDLTALIFNPNIPPQIILIHKGVKLCDISTSSDHVKYLLRVQMHSVDTESASSGFTENVSCCY